MAKTPKKENKISLDLVTEIFKDDTPEYHHIKQLAEQDLGKELIGRIEKFLEDRKETKVEEIKKIVFDDASKVGEQNINDIVDAFVRMRSEQTLTEIDQKSINDILILFNQWVTVGKSQQEPILPKDIFSGPSIGKKEETLNLEEQVNALRGHMPNTEELYKTHTPALSTAMGQIYSQEPQLYENVIAEFITGEHHDCEHDHYKSKALYKTHK